MVTPTLEPAAAASAVVGLGATTLSATGADGTQYVFAIPSGAFESSTAVTMTPVTRLAGLSGTASQYAVEFQPSGTTLNTAGVLTITPPVAPTRGLLGVQWSADGSLDLHPAALRGSGWTIAVDHFSGYGGMDGDRTEMDAVAAKIQAFDEADSLKFTAERRAELALTRWQRDWDSRGPDDEPGLRARFVRIMTDWFSDPETGVLALLDKADRGLLELELGLSTVHRFNGDLEAGNHFGTGGSEQDATLVSAQDQALRKAKTAMNTTFDAYTMPNCSASVSRWQAWYEVPFHLASRIYTTPLRLGEASLGDDMVAYLKGKLLDRSCLEVVVENPGFPARYASDDVRASLTADVRGLRVHGHADIVDLRAPGEAIPQPQFQMFYVGKAYEPAPRRIEGNGGAVGAGPGMPNYARGDPTSVISQVEFGPDAQSVAVKGRVVWSDSRAAGTELLWIRSEFEKTAYRDGLQMTGPTGTLPLGPRSNEVCGQVNADPAATWDRSITFGLSGPGSLSATSATAGADGKACINYVSPADPVATGTLATVTGTALVGGRNYRGKLDLTPYWMAVALSTYTAYPAFGPGTNAVCANLTDSAGSVSGKTLAFAVSGEGSVNEDGTPDPTRGRLDAHSVRTGADGQACVNYVRPNRLVGSGQTSQLKATYTQGAFTTTDTKTIQPYFVAARIFLGTRDISGTTLDLGSGFRTTLTLHLTDSFGSLAGKSVTVNAGSAGATVNGSTGTSTVTTDAAGLATLDFDGIDPSLGPNFLVTATYGAYPNRVVGSATLATAVDRRFFGHGGAGAVQVHYAPTCHRANGSSCDVSYSSSTLVSRPDYTPGRVHLTLSADGDVYEMIGTVRSGVFTGTRIDYCACNSPDFYFAATITSSPGGISADIRMDGNGTHLVIALTRDP